MSKHLYVSHWLAANAEVSLQKCADLSELSLFRYKVLDTLARLFCIQDEYQNLVLAIIGLIIRKLLRMFGPEVINFLHAHFTRACNMFWT